MKKYILLAAAVVLAVAGALVFWGSSFAKSMVHDQLLEQKISFPSANQLKSEGDLSLVKYGGQAVDNGTKAKAYSDYIKGHLEKVANGQTYSEVSGAWQKDQKNATLIAQRQTLFMGETLRGLLLSAYGWGLMGLIAFWTSLGMFAAAAVALVAYLYLAAQTGKKPAKRARSTRAKSKK